MRPLNVRDLDRAYPQAGLTCCVGLPVSMTTMHTTAPPPPSPYLGQDGTRGWPWDQVFWGHDNQTVSNALWCWSHGKLWPIKWHAYSTACNVLSCECCTCYTGQQPAFWQRRPSSCTYSNWCTLASRLLKGLTEHPLDSVLVVGVGVGGGPGEGVTVGVDLRSMSYR